MADINIAVVAKNEASSALAQVNADLANLAKQAQDTGNAFVSIGRTQFSLGAGSTALRDTIQDLRNATEQANILKQAISAPTQVTNAGGVENVTIAAREAESELKNLLKQYQELAKQGDLEFGQGTDANLQRIQTAITQQIAEVKQVRIESQAAAKAGILGDGAAVAAQINQATRPVQLLTQALKGTETQAEKTKSALDKVSKGGSPGQVKSSIEGADKALGSFVGTLTGGLGGVAGLVGLGATVTAIGAIGTAIDEAVQSAERADKIKFSFDALAQSAGQSGEVLLRSMRAAANGTVDDSELMLAANRATLLGVRANAEEMGSLLSAAAARAGALGISTGDAFDRIVTGIGQLNGRMLSSVGIVIDQQRVFDDYAAQLNKTAQQLTETEQRQALLNATIEKSKSITAGGGVGASTAAAQAQVAKGNLQEDAGRFFAPGDRDFAQAQIDLIDRLTGKYDQLGVALREINDLQADSKSDSPLAVKIAPEQLANAQQLGDAIILLNQAQAAGIAGLGEYTNKLAELDNATTHGINATQQQADSLSLIVFGLRGKIDAHNAEVEAQRKSNEEAQKSIPFFKSLAEAQRQTAIDMFHASDEARRLGAGLDFAGKIALAASNNLDEFNAALKRIKAQDATKGTFDSIRQGAISKAQSAVQKGVDDGRTSVEGGTSELTKLVTQINSIPDPTNTSTVALFRFQNQVDGVADSSERANDAFAEQNAAAKKLAEDGLQAVKQQYDDIVGKAAGVISEAQQLPSFKAHQLFNMDELKKFGLQGDSQVTVDQAVDLSGARPDAINENARRLMAIATEGLKDQPWLEEFKREVPEIFKELSDSPDIRGSAFKILQEFEQGLRPELLDKGQIKDRVKAMIIGDQNAAALAQEIAQEIASEMGISLQQAMGATSAALGLDGGQQDGAGAGIQAPDLTTQGTEAGVSLRTGMVAGFDASGLTVEILAKIDAEFSNPKSIDAIKKSGGSVGAVWGGGFLATAGNNIPPGLYDILVSGLVPLIVAAIGAGSTRTGAQP